MAYHRMWGENLKEVCLLTLLATESLNTPKLTRKIGKHMQNQLWEQKIINTIIMKSLRSKTNAKMLKNISHDKRNVIHFIGMSRPLKKSRM
jgi:hypothetical protein